MRRSITIALAVAFMAAQAPVPAPAQEAPQKLPVFIKAQPLEKLAPKYPAMMADQSREGWVILSFTITAEGKTANIEVLDSSDRAKRFHEAAIEAVSTWRYTPAQVDGKPVEQRNNELPVVFTIRTSGGNPMGGSDITRSRIRRIDNLLAEGKLEEARLVLEEAEGGYRGLNLYEYSHLFARWHLYHRAKGTIGRA
ncbi:energy transducer TonB [Aerophototrophica crusticola]|uniref:Protein TonB n=1 Tax=Aerophototrophica crusticola TaxID=1709002 RepID=A0A858R383_9PROT|nr:energy transducer TonB [Rhodospirillaceae bacterium B3]